MTPFRALRIHELDGRIVARFDELTLGDLSPGEVVVRVRWSDINYKDALAATGHGRVLRRYPLVGGIDLAGDVESSADARFAPGDPVLVVGCGLGETHDGGYAPYARVAADWLVPLPGGLTLEESMRLGTAGYTAALAIHRMEQNGQRPANGPVVVTGATGGVGSLAIDMLAARGYEVVAVSGKAHAEAYLLGIGARRVLRREEIDYGRRPLETAQWAGAIDNVGGTMLTWLTRTTGFWGNIACVGLAGSHELQTTVMPFVLRGVNLLGINSTYTPRELRLAVWQRIATDLRPHNLERICTRTIDLDALPGAFQDYIDGSVLGRTVVRIG
jgi:NADPH2:quinone reductase